MTKYAYRLIPFELDFKLIYNTLQYNSYEILQGKNFIHLFHQANLAHATRAVDQDRRSLVKAKFDNHYRVQNFEFNVYLCWLLAWSAALPYQARNEKVFLVLQAIEVLKRMVYKCEVSLPIEIFKVMMQTTYDHGGSLRNLKSLEACVDEFKLPSNITIQLMSLNALAMDKQEQFKDSVVQNRQDLSHFYTQQLGLDTQYVSNNDMIRAANPTQAREE